MTSPQKIYGCFIHCFLWFLHRHFPSYFFIGAVHNTIQTTRIYDSSHVFTLSKQPLETGTVPPTRNSAGWSPSNLGGGGRGSRRSRTGSISVFSVLKKCKKIRNFSLKTLGSTRPTRTTSPHRECRKNYRFHLGIPTSEEYNSEKLLVSVRNSRQNSNISMLLSTKSSRILW